MKRLRSTILFLSLISGLNAWCDIIPDNSHYVDKCIKITNIDQFDNVSMIAYEWYVGNYHMGNTIIDTSTCVPISYKFDDVYVYAINSDYLEDKEIDDLDLPNISNALVTDKDLSPYEGYYNDSNPINSINQYYRIVGFTDTSAVIFKWKEVYGFNDGSEDSVLTYQNTSDTSSLSQKITTNSTAISVSSEESLTIYPNPVNGFVGADIKNSYEGEIKIKIYDINGKTIKALKTQKSNKTLYVRIPLTDVAPGTYLLSVKSGSTVKTSTIIIQ